MRVAKLPFLRRLARDERGLSIVELGLVAPVLTLFVAGIIDLSMGLAERFATQQAVNQSLELVMARPPELGLNEDELDFSYVKSAAASAAGVSEDQVELDLWLQCEDERMANFDDSCDPGEDSARYLSVQVEKPFSGHFFVGDTTIVVDATVRFQ